jgi:hypothetical protein
MLVSLSILGELMGGYGGEVLGAVGRLVRSSLRAISAKSLPKILTQKIEMEGKKFNSNKIPTRFAIVESRKNIKFIPPAPSPTGG